MDRRERIDDELEALKFSLGARLTQVWTALPATVQSFDPASMMAINFFRPTDAAISAVVTLRPLAGYTTATGVAIQNAIAAYINGVPIGGGAAAAVEWDECITQAKLVSGAGTFKIVSLALTGPRGAGAPDVALLFNEAASCTAAAVTITPITTG
ncbi:hypothetical protein [Burkholderia glumae]|uniref:hypothetical protein n=1 Tax=Burkholderia glumae TaxID=337 RepID=UPI002036CA58|nr:hypothetical protein [Burkholderia glumae]MCM2550482.1 hypothetical protein [Burkholderia glumae]